MEKNAEKTIAYEHINHGNHGNYNWLDFIIGYIRTELENPLIYQQIISPIVRRIIWMMIPYGLCFVLLNFFTTILAVGLVVYFRSNK